MELVRRLKESGQAVCLITHDIESVFEVCDRVAVMRLGRIRAIHDIKDITRDQIVGLLHGAVKRFLFRPVRQSDESAQGQHQSLRRAAQHRPRRGRRPAVHGTRRPHLPFRLHSRTRDDAGRGGTHHRILADVLVLLTTSNLLGMASSAAYFAIVGVSMTVLFIVGEFDLSLGAVYGLTCTIIAYVKSTYYGPWLSG